VTSDLTLRTATPADYDRIVGVLDDWWGRPVSHGRYDGPGDVKVKFERPLP
jgi:hypothetical protein